MVGEELGRTGLFKDLSVGLRLPVELVVIMH